MQLADDDSSTIFYDAAEEQMSLLSTSRSKSDDDDQSGPTDSRSLGYCSRCVHEHDKEDRASAEHGGPPHQIKFMSTPSTNGSQTSDGDAAPAAPVAPELIHNKRSAQWFDEETSVDPPSPPPGHSPSSAFELHKYSPRLHGCNGQAVSLSLPEIEREHSAHVLQSSQMDDPVDDPVSWHHNTNVKEYSDSSNEEDNNAEDQNERDYGFFTIVHADSNVLSDVSMTSPVPPNSMEKAPSVDSAYVVSPVSQLEDSISRQIRSPPRWLPSPLSTGTASTKRQKGRRDLTKGYSGGSERGGVDRWTPRALFRKSPSSAQQRNNRKVEDDKVRNVTRTSTTSSTDNSEENIRSNSCGSSPFDDTIMNDNPFIIADDEEIDTATYPDKGGIIRELDDGGIECQLFPSQADLLEEPKQAIMIDSEQSPNTEGSRDSPTSLLDTNQQRFPDNHRRYRMTPRKLFGEFSPRLKSPLKRKMAKKDVFTPLDVLPTNAVSVQGDRDERKTAATSTSDPLLLINSITMAHAGPIWRMEFSHDGKYLATGGEDGLLSVYEVAPKKAKPLSHPCPTAAALAEWEAAQGAPPPTDPLGTGPPLGCEVNILSSKPLRRYREHAGDIGQSSQRISFFFCVWRVLNLTILLFFHSHHASQLICVGRKQTSSLLHPLIRRYAFGM